jgi:hypothetical protein
MDETRFASTNVLKALHEDRQREERGPADKTLKQPLSPTMVAPAGDSKKTMMIGAAAAAVLVLGIAGYVMTRPDPTPDGGTTTTATAPAASAPTQTASPPPAPAVPAATQAAAPPAQKVATATDKPAPPVQKKSAPPPAETPAAPTTPAFTPAPVRGRAVNVVLSAAYPFAVMDGSREISPSSRSHELSQSVGRSLRIVAPEVFLDHPFRVGEGTDGRFEYTPPGLGRIQIRAARGDCKAMIRNRDLGYGPWPNPFPAAAGSYQVNLICPDGQNPTFETTVTAGFPAQVFFKK